MRYLLSKPFFSASRHSFINATLIVLDETLIEPPDTGQSMVCSFPEWFICSGPMSSGSDGPDASEENVCSHIFWGWLGGDWVVTVSPLQTGLCRFQSYAEFTDVNASSK